MDSKDSGPPLIAFSFFRVHGVLCIQPEKKNSANWSNIDGVVTGNDPICVNIGKNKNSRLEADTASDREFLFFESNFPKLL
jgi:hypothetical protein